MRARDAGFIRALATVMAIVQVAGFLVQLAAGRSSFHAPPIVHMHAIAAMGWVSIFVTQAWLAAAGARQWHRRLGVLALVWATAFVILGALVTINAVRTGRVPFFFQPQYLLVADPLSAIAFFALLLTAVALRGRADWHPRLQICAFVLLMGPSFGRMLPMPLMVPHSFEIASLAPLIFPVFGAVRDWRVRGKPHPAWIWAFVVLAVVLTAARLIVYSPVGDALYSAVTAGTPAAGVSGLAYPPPPPH